MTDLVASPVDFALVGGQRTPGPTCELVGAAMVRQWDKQRPSGQSGGRLVYKGRDFSEFTMRLQLWTSEDWTAWDAFAPVLTQPPTADSTGTRSLRGLDFSHPITDLLGIRSVVLKDLGQPVQDDTGGWTIDIKLLEYRDPVPSQARARGSRNAPVDPADIEILALRLEAQALAARYP